ncbi:4387_t:CDS:1, partial [Gigaspora margarita]
SSVTSHIAGAKHIQKCVSFEKNQKNKLQQTMPAALKSGESKKKLIYDLLEAWVNANIPIQKLNKFREFLSTYCREGGAVLEPATLYSQYLPHIFERHLGMLRKEFFNKPVAIIVDETTDSRAC